MLRVLRFGKVLILLLLFQFCDNWGFVYFSFWVNRELDLKRLSFLSVHCVNCNVI